MQFHNRGDVRYVGRPYDILNKRESSMRNSVGRLATAGDLNFGVLR